MTKRLSGEELESCLNLRRGWRDDLIAHIAAIEAELAQETRERCEAWKMLNGNSTRQLVDAVEAELAEAREIDSVQASMLGPLRTRLALAEAVCEAAEKFELESLRRGQASATTEAYYARALSAWRKAKGET